jgi:hypothetical protein
MAYEPLFWETFDECKQEHSRNPNLIHRLETIVKRVIETPLHPQSHWLERKGKIDLRGKRSRHFASHYCVVYLVCDACINNRFRELGYNNCHFCMGEKLKRVIFLAFGHHDDIYAREWGIPQYDAQFQNKSS